MALGLRPALPRSQSLEYSFGPLAPPIGQQRRVQTFAAEQSAQTTSRRSNDFFEDALLIFRGVGPPLWLGNYFGVRYEPEAGSAPALAVAAVRCGSLRSPSLRFATAKKNNTKRIPAHLFLFLSRPTAH
jgi:hypothetical protein